MSALSSLVDDAVAAAISNHPTLFVEKQRERARKVLTREIVKTMTREPKAEDGDGERESESAAPFEFLPASDPRARAYLNLRRLAGAPEPTRLDGDRIGLPRVADTPSVMALADLPNKPWPFVSGPQLASWLEFFSGALPHGTARRKITRLNDMGTNGADLPWPWPPSKDGRVYSAASDDNQRSA